MKHKTFIFLLIYLQRRVTFVIDSKRGRSGNILQHLALLMRHRVVLEVYCVLEILKRMSCKKAFEQTTRLREVYNYPIVLSNFFVRQMTNLQ